MAEFAIKTNRRNEIVDITEAINSRIPSGLKSGICLIFCPHTTAGITINENADPDVKHDLLAKIEKMIPPKEAFYQHSEGNSDAHLKAALMGFSETVPIKNGKLYLGIWQGIYFCEFDGPRTRNVRLFFQNAKED